MRRVSLVDCNPRWVVSTGDLSPRGVSFDCPEGHEGCHHVIPFTPALDGTPRDSWQQNGAIWQRSGDTFETLVLSPSIRREPVYLDKATALAAGADEKYLEPTHFCALHIFIGGSSGQIPGQIEFCGDSR